MSAFFDDPKHRAEAEAKYYEYIEKGHDPVEAEKMALCYYQYISGIWGDEDNYKHSNTSITTLPLGNTTYCDKLIKKYRKAKSHSDIKHKSFRNLSLAEIQYIIRKGNVNGHLVAKLFVYRDMFGDKIPVHNATVFDTSF